MILDKLKNTIKENRMASACIGYLFLAALFSSAVPLFSPYSYSDMDLQSVLRPAFSKGHVFGTDELGRDLFVRVFYGIRISLTIGFMAAFFQCVIGVLYGGLSGMLGGIWDEIMMRFADVVFAIPYLLIVILASLLLGNGLPAMILALAIADWTGMARLVRAETLRLRSTQFADAARMLGGGRLYILFRHILPNCMGSIITGLTLSVPSAIFSEAFLSFIGIGVRVPQASLGTLASDGYRFILTHPGLLIIPLFFISTIMLALNILGDSLKFRS